MSNFFRSARWKQLFLLLGCPILLICVGLGILSMLSQRPDNLGVANGKLAECPASPNCVSSQTKSTEHRMPALSYTGNYEKARTKLKEVIARSCPRARLVDDSELYLRYEFSSLLFRFVDDVEFLVDDRAKIIDFRSASRIGHSDLGANRRRMTRISKEFLR